MRNRSSLFFSTICIIYLIIIGFIDYYLKIDSTYINSSIINLLFTLLSCIGFGLILGSDKQYRSINNTFSKQTFNIKRFLTIGTLPIIYITLYVLLTIGIDLSILSIHIKTIFQVDNTIIILISILLGYASVTSFEN